MSTIVGLCKWFTLVVVSPPKYYISHIDINLAVSLGPSICTIKKQIQCGLKFGESEMNKLIFGFV